MTKLIYVILISFISISTIWAQENIARITIFSSPNQIKIRLNSVIIGETPLEKIEVEPGNYHLEAISLAPGIWNNTNISKRFTIKSGQDTTIYINFHHPVKINSIPYSAILYQENRQLGTTPLDIPFEENRGKEFRLEKPGYKTLTFILNNPDSKLFTLQKIDLSSSYDESPSFTHSLFHKKTKTKFILIAGTVAAHWMAFYFKNLADDNYEKYLVTGNPNLMNKYWDNTQKYDRISDISLGISYAFLGGLIYTVLWK